LGVGMNTVLAASVVGINIPANWYSWKQDVRYVVCPDGSSVHVAFSKVGVDELWCCELAVGVTWLRAGCELWQLRVCDADGVVCCAGVADAGQDLPDQANEVAMGDPAAAL
jgi:hypothetical protein